MCLKPWLMFKEFFGKYFCTSLDLCGKILKFHTFAGWFDSQLSLRIHEKVGKDAILLIFPWLLKGIEIQDVGHLSGCTGNKKTMPVEAENHESCLIFSAISTLGNFSNLATFPISNLLWENNTHYLFHQRPHETLMSSEMKHDERQARCFQSLSHKRNGQPVQNPRFLAKMNSVPDAAHAVYFWGYSQKAWHWQLFYPTRCCRAEDLQDQFVTQLK